MSAGFSKIEMKYSTLLYTKNSDAEYSAVVLNMDSVSQEGAASAVRDWYPHFTSEKIAILILNGTDYSFLDETELKSDKGIYNKAYCKLYYNFDQYSMLYSVVSVDSDAAVEDSEFKNQKEVVSILERRIRNYNSAN